MDKKGKVYIVGAGPGNGGLISVRGRELLGRADCVLYDRLIGAELLGLVAKKAEKIYVGKEHTRNSPKQKDINELIIKKARIHKIVVRLKGGDPMIFGRASEELKCLAANKIDFEIIPGITAASAAAACAGVVLTDRNTASSVTFITGHTTSGREVNIDFKSLVKLKGTIVFYMAVGNLNRICKGLIKAGLAANTNVIVAANASLANQRIVKGNVSNIAEKCAENNIEPPAIVIIGKNCFSWLSNKPLFGKRILVTRDLFGNAEFACKLAARGAETIDCPMFEIEDLTGKKEFKNIIERIKNFDWVIFTSPTGVKLFFSAINKLNKDARVFGKVKIACIGSETAGAIEEFNIRADFVPKVFTSEKLAESFIKKYKPAGKKILLLRSALADSYLAEKLKSAKAKVKAISIYTAKKVEIASASPRNDRGKVRTDRKKASNDTRGVCKGIKSKPDWITFASSFAVKCFFEKVESKDVQKIKVASIGPVTTETLKMYGITPTVEAKEHTIDGLIAAMEEAE